MKKITKAFAWLFVQPPFKIILLMKGALLLIMFTCLQVSASVYAQKKFSLDLNQTEVSNILTRIQKESDYRFFYNYSSIKKLRKVTLHVKDASINDVLEAVLGNKLPYKITADGVVFIYDQGTAQAQVPIKGKVVDTKGETLIGVSVKLQGTNVGATTNANGEFVINAPENGVLEFSYVGYERQIVKIAGQTNLTITMVETNSNLDEIVIVGYGTAKKIDVTGSIASVKGSDIQNLPVSTVASALEGRATGVNIVRNDGTPGAAPSIRIRGTGTINDANPLVVIDGVPSNNPDALSDVNPNDIASVEILKDASSSAIYGTRAANGVVLVTTKRGTYSQKLSTSINAYTGVSKSTKYIDLLTAPDLYMLKRERYTNDGVAFEQPWEDAYYATQRTDWQKAILGSGKVNNIDVNIQGGNETSTYYFSTSFYDEKGIIDKSYFKRFSTRINSEHKIKPWLKVGQNLQVTYGENNGFNNNDSQAGLLFSALRYNPAIPTVNEDGSFGTSKAFANQLGDINNPYATIQKADAYNRKYRAVANVFAEVPIYKDLNFRVNYGFDGTINRSYSFDIQDLNQARQNPNSTLSQGEEDNYSHLLDLLLIYDKQVNKHHITFTGGYSLQSFRGSFFSAARTGYDDTSKDQRTLDNGKNLLAANGTYRDPYGLESVFARGFYDYDSRFLATLTFRADGSSKFASSNRWGYFPAFSLGWRLSNEQFMKNISWISNLKITGGWGELGNQNIDGFQYLSKIVVGNGYGTNGYTFGGNGVSGSAVIKTANPDITWERAAMTNVSVEAGFLQNKLNTTITWFDKNTESMLVPALQIGTTGRVSAPDRNIGTMNNHGIEVDLNYQSGNEFQYSFGVNGSFIKNKVTQLYGTGAFIPSTVYGRSSQEISRTYEGQPVASFYGWKTAGLYQNQADINNDPYLTNDSRKGLIKPGDVRFVDINGDGKIDGLDRTYLGNPNPKATLGFQTKLSYKGIDLSANLAGVFGVSLYNADRMQGVDPTYSFNLYAEALNRWTGPGTSNSMPRMSLDRSNDNYRTSDLFIENGNYVSLKNLTLGYTIPASIMKKSTLNSLRLYVTGQNLFMITNYSGYTPELGYTNGNRQRGVDVAQYPSVRSFTFGLTLKL